MRRFVLLLGFLAGAVPGWSQSGLFGDLPVTASSRSGQFIVHGRGPELPAPAESLERVGTNPMVTLHPELLVVTAERVKRAVEHRLGIVDSWRSRIHIQLRDSSKMTGPVSIRPFQFRDGWQFAIPLPDRVEWDRLVRALVEVVLLERANRRNESGECALVPLWLTEGFTQLLLADEGRDLVAEAATVLIRSRVKPDPLVPIRATLANVEPMTFSELGLVTTEQLADPARFREFQATSALLTWELLRDEVGRKAMLRFVEQLPTNLNWQTTFLQTSLGRFNSLLDVEKWWAVASAETLTDNPSQQWSRDRVLQHLSELVVETTEVRADTNSPPVRRRVPLSELIEKWDFATQQGVLRRKIPQLKALTIRATPELAQLSNDYARTLDSYVRARERAGFGTVARGELEARGNFLAAAAVRKLAELDRRLEQERAFRPAVSPAPAQLGGRTNLRTVAPSPENL
ncbi:MAG TPA: hypothetical protein PLX89_26960 [Verrucomicrobiota bacterium]|nr:hypothetical protein [Verrucomicrobiales bacterium]HRI16649.1 hypothetical protein [Verrucomicrobiota bacterium]